MATTESSAAMASGTGGNAGGQPLNIYDRATLELMALARTDGAPPVTTFTPTGPRAELGWGGASIFGGIVAEEFNPDLQGVEAIRTATKMRRTNGQVRAVEQIISLPVRSTSWFLEEPGTAAAPTSAAEKECTELLRANLFGGMETSWDDLLREGCLGVYYGFRTPELVWEERSGRLELRKIASRNPELIERWLYDEAGELAGLLYVGNRPVGVGLQPYTVGFNLCQRIPLPRQKFVHFVYSQENENPQGFGLWRSMYPHWYFLQALYKILGVGIERNLLGVPVAKQELGVGAAFQEVDKTAIQAQLRRLRAATDSTLVLPPGWSVDWFESERNLMDVMPFLYHHDAKIAQVALAQFLNLGQTGAGTQALGAVQAKLFENAEEAVARWIEQTINEQVIKRWVLLNYGTGVRPPVVRHKPIRSLDLTAWAQALTALVTANMVHPMPADEDQVRDLMELPDVPAEQLKSLWEQAEQAKQQQQQATIAALQAKAQPAQQDPNKPEGTDTRKGAEVCDGHQFADAAGQDHARKQREAQEAAFAEKAAQLLTGIQEGYVAALKPLVEEAENADKIRKGQPLAKLTDVQVPGAGRYREFLRSYLWTILQEGRAAIASETGGDAADQPVSNRLRQWLTAKANVLAADHVSRLQTAVLTRVLTGIRAELPTSVIFSDAGATAVETLSAETQQDWAAAAAELLAQIESS